MFWERKRKSPEEEAEAMMLADVSRGYCRRDPTSKAERKQMYLEQLTAGNNDSPNQQDPQENEPKKNGWFYKSGSTSYGRNQTGPVEMPEMTSGLISEEDAMEALMDVLAESQGLQKSRERNNIVPRNTSIVNAPEPEKLTAKEEEKAQRDSVYIQLDSEGYPIYPSEESKFRGKNRIVAVDRFTSIFLVEARNTRDISPGAGYELRANIFKTKNRPIIVDFGHTVDLEDPFKYIDRLIKKGHIYPATGVIVPRKVRLLTDVMLGYKHNPVIIDSHSIPDNAFDDIKKQMDNYWEPPYYEV